MKRKTQRYLLFTAYTVLVAVLVFLLPNEGHPSLPIVCIGGSHMMFWFITLFLQIQLRMIKLIEIGANYFILFMKISRIAFLIIGGIITIATPILAIATSRFEIIGSSAAGSAMFFAGFNIKNKIDSM